ncbi:MAG: RDD family protein [Saprospiraceae bacterium]|nr:RDD family protein [Saprospiraceae bacterium]
MRIASVGQRVIALMLDFLVFALLSTAFVLLFLKTENFRSDSGSGFSVGLAFPIYVMILWWLTWVFLISLTEYRTGQTLGKRIIRIKVVKEDYTETTFWISLMRHFFDIVDLCIFVGIFIALTNNKKQRIADMVVKTIVVKK